MLVVFRTAFDHVLGINDALRSSHSVLSLGLVLGQKLFLPENSEILFFAIFLVLKANFFVEKGHVSV